MNYIFLMDPLESIKYGKDTTFALMLGAYFKNHRVFFLPRGGITIKDGLLFFKVTEVVPQKNQAQLFIKKENLLLSQDDVHVVFIRTDPPFGEEYLLDTWLLDRLPKTIPVINAASGIRTANEKLWVTQFLSLIPKTMVTRDKSDFIDFLDQEIDVVIKPVNLYGGSSIFQIHRGDTNAHVTFETLSHQGTKEVIVQKYVKEATQGDKRILLLDGEPLGAILRVHNDVDHRNNFYSGGRPKPVDVTSHDIKIINILKPHLRSLGLFFVGIDIIGDHLIEVNVTSPTCLQEMNAFYDTNLEYKVISFAESLVIKYKNRP